MALLWIHAEPSSGADIRQAADAAIDLAARAAVGVHLAFNGLQLPVRRSTTVEEVVFDYHRKLALANLEDAADAP